MKTKSSEVGTMFMKLSTGPLIKASDENGIEKFARDVEECNVTLSHLKYFSDLNNFENIFKIVQRLPFELKLRWLRMAAKVEQARHEASFADLVTFVKQEAEVMKTLYAKLLDRSKKNFSSFSVHSKVTEKAGKQRPEFCLEAKCRLCSANHKLQDCHIFKSKTVAERKLLTRQYRLCDNCFKRGHTAERCFLRTVCTVDGCKFKHHELLYDSNRGSFEQSTAQDKTQGVINTRGTATIGTPSSNVPSHSVTTDMPMVFLNIFPVRITCGDNEVVANAFLGQGSSTSLCDSRLLQQIQLQGEKTSFSLTTVNKVKEKRHGFKVRMCVTSNDGGETLERPNVLTVDSLPVSLNAPVSSKDLQRWRHLRDLHLPPAARGDVLLLIGADVSEAFWTLEERRGKWEEPYALRTVLGWSLLGPAQQNEPFYSSRLCHGLTSHKASRVFEDRYALHLMNTSTRFVDGHYQLRLPRIAKKVLC